MTNYSKGAGYERKLMKELQEQGYFVVRAAGSHSAADLAAFGNMKAKLIQVKSSRRRIVGLKAVQAAFKADLKKLAEIKLSVPFVDVELWLWTFHKGWRVFGVYSQGNIEEIKPKQTEGKT
jgi:Holliday junction resolvase